MWSYHGTVCYRRVVLIAELCPLFMVYGSAMACYNHPPGTDAIAELCPLLMVYVSAMACYNHPPGTDESLDDFYKSIEAGLHYTSDKGGDNFIYTTNSLDLFMGIYASHLLTSNMPYLLRTVFRVPF